VNPATGIYEFEDYNRDGKISYPDDYESSVFTGQQYFGGLGNNLEFGRWQLNIFLQFVRQKYAEGYQRGFSRPGGLTNVSQVVMDRWQQPGDITDIQKFSNSNSIGNTAYANYIESDGVYEDASFIRIKNVELAYNLLTENDRSVIKNARIFFQGQNLVTFTKYRGADPETNAALPTMRLLSFGMNITF
jgi:hypothetical protein